MSEMRWHPLRQEWVITATHRMERTFKPPKEFCPLCPTPPGGFPSEVPAADYEIVVFENRFPSLHIDPPKPDVAGNALHPAEPARGVCEVVLYSQDHDAQLSDMSADHVHALVRVWTDRYEALGARDEVQYVYIFENRGEAVGVTLNHPHGQIYAFPFIPPTPARELAAADRHWAKTGRCLTCDIVADELEDDRVLWQDDHFAAYVPFFARFPYEVHITAKDHLGSLTDLAAPASLSLARAIKAVTGAYDNLFGFPLPYMMAMHQRPTDGADYPASHFRIDFYPLQRAADKLKYLAGVESGAGTFITDMAPEEQARRLQEAVL